MVSEKLLEQFSIFIETKFGLDFPKGKWGDLERELCSLTKDLGFSEEKDFIDHISSSPVSHEQEALIAGRLTIGETYFQRESKAFEALEDYIIPELYTRRRTTTRHLRIWSAGCCTGEEVYSLAILLHRTIPDIEKWDITLHGTDINPRFLNKARHGTYTEWSFRNVPSWFKTTFFTRLSNSSYLIRPEIKRMVTFSELNLVKDTWPSAVTDTNAMDIIFCRNVLMYFSPRYKKQVIGKLYEALVHEGWLVVSSVETSPVLYSGYAVKNLTGLTLYRKETPPQSPANEHPFPAFLPVEEKKSPLPDQVVTVEPVQVVTGKQEEPPSSSIDDPYSEAQELYRSGYYAEAAQKLNGLTANNEVSSDISELMAKIYANLGDLKQALVWCEKAIESNKLEPKLYYLQATILEENGNDVSAIQSLKRSLYLDHDFVLAYYVLGTISLRLGRFDRADRYFENAVSLLDGLPEETIIPESDAMTAGRLMDIINSRKQPER